MIYFRFYFSAYDCPCHHHEETMGITAESEEKARDEFWAGKPDCREDIEVEIAPDWRQPDSNVPAQLRLFEAWKEATP